MTAGPGNVQYSYAQLEGIWQQAGGDPQYANMAAAIAMAESGGGSAEYGVNGNGTIDRGLWQINSVHGSQSSFDVMTNARAAVALSSNGRNWRPWCTAYADGACGTRGGAYLGQGAPYQKFLQGNVPPDLNAPINATNAAANVTGTSNAQTTGGCGTLQTFFDPAGCAVKDSETVAINVIKILLAAVINPFMQIVAGIMGMGGGLTLVVLGLFQIIRQSQAYENTKSDVKAGAGALAWLAGPEAGVMGAATAGQPTAVRSSSQQRLRMGGFTATRRQQGPSTAEILRAESQRYAAQSRNYEQYSMNYRAYLKARQK